MVYTCTADEQANDDCDCSVAEMCKVLDVARCGYYDRLPQPSNRVISDRQLCCAM